MIKYAYDQGITYFDTADAYQTHQWVREAIKGMPREKLFRQSKMLVGAGMRRGGAAPASPLETLNCFRKEIGVDYIDSLLIHCQTSQTWDEDNKQIMEDLDKAKEKGYIRSHGVSCHSLAATTKAASLEWVDVNLVIINPQGVNVDSGSRNVFDQRIVHRIKCINENNSRISLQFNAVLVVA